MRKPILEWSDDELIAVSDELALRVMRKETTVADVRLVHELAVRLRSANKRLLAAEADALGVRLPSSNDADDYSITVGLAG